MTDQTGPSSGWYPDPELPRQMRYWDGHRWTEQRFETPDDPNAHPVGPGFGRLAQVIRVGLVLSVLVLIGEVALYAWGLSMFDNAFATGDVDSLNLFDDLHRALSVSRLVLTLATGICWVFWQFRLARSAKPGLLRRDAGWHAGSWFIPFANFVMPFQNMRDLWRRFVSEQTSVIGWWWTAFILSSLVAEGAPHERPGHALADLHLRVWFLLASALISIAAAALAIRIISSLTAMGLGRASSAAVSPGATQAD